MFSIFGSSSPFDTDVVKATNENNTTDQWDLIIDICDKVGSSSLNAKDCIRSIMKRLGHNDPHVAIQAITLLDACIKNCGMKFHLEIASREFEQEFLKLMSRASPPIALKMRVSLKKWAENEFKSDSQLNLIPSLYQKMKAEGLDFTDSATQPTKIQAPLSKDPNVVSSQQEEDDIAKAIELSLKEKGDAPKVQQSASAYSSLYPSMNSDSNQYKNSPTNSSTKRDARKVRALYDFEAAEDNELTFFSGEIIHVLDDSDPNWWTGFNDRGEGLFPSNFVTADLNAEIESNHYESKTKKQSTNDVKEEEEQKQEIVQIDEVKIDRLLQLLHDANPEDPSQDTEEMFILEAQVNQMLPLIDSELERVDRHHAKLTQLSSNLVDAVNMYHMLMRESDMQLTGYGMSQMPGQMYRQTGPPMSNGMYHPNMYAVSSNYAMPTQIGTHQIQPQMGMSPQQYQPNSVDPTKFIPNAHAMSPPQTHMPHQMPPHQYQQQYPVPNEQPQSIQQQPLQQPQMQQQSAPVPNMHPVPQTHNQNGASGMPQQQMHQSPMPHGAPQGPHSHFQHQMIPPPNYGMANSGQGMPPAMMNNQPNMQMNPGHLPNTVMTTQVQHQQEHQQQAVMQNPSPNHQIPNAMAAINQPVSTTILPQNDMRSNIPIYQQQR